MLRGGVGLLLHLRLRPPGLAGLLHIAVRLNVLGEVVGPYEPLLADLARVVPLVLVRSHVSGQLVGPEKVLGATWLSTFEWPNPQVRKQVSPKVRGRAISFEASDNVTRMELLDSGPLVHSGDADGTGALLNPRSPPRRYVLLLLIFDSGTRGRRARCQSGTRRVVRSGGHSYSAKLFGASSGASVDP